MNWEEKCAEAQEYFKRLQYNPRITVNLTKGERIVDELIQAAEEEIANWKYETASANANYTDALKEIARLREALKPLINGTYYITHEDVERARELLGEQ